MSIRGQTQEFMIYATNYCKKQIDVSFSRVRPAIHKEFPHNIDKVACGSTINDQ